MSLCIFGDSVAKGVIYDEAKKKYIFLKDNFVSNFAPEGNMTVKNYAKFGCTTEKGAEILKKHSNELCDYNYTVLEFGGNDCDYNWANVAAAPEQPHLPNVPFMQFSKNYEDIIAKVRASGSKPLVLSLPPLDAQRFFDWVSKGLNKENILKFLGDVDYIYRWHESYSLCITELAKKLKVPLIDIRKDFLATPDYPKLLCCDGMHPNQQGHNLITASIKKTMLSF